MRNGKYHIIFLLAAVISIAGCSTAKEQAVMKHNAALPQEAPFWGKLLHGTCSSEEKENLCLSPLSAQLAIAMTAAGAEGETLEQMRSVIQLHDICKDTADLINGFHEETGIYDVGLANSIWINDRLNVKESFVSSNRKNFGAEVSSIPFNKQAAARINSWCKEKTGGKIEKIIDKVEPTNRMFLINALYFKASWRTPFKAQETRKAEFTTNNGRKTEVDMMKQTFNTSYYSDEIVQIASKPFKKRFEMLFILPCNNKSIDDAIGHFAVNYRNCIDSMTHNRIELSLPKFRSEYDTSLRDVLCSMGMEIPFGDKAQFGGISKTPLYIDNIIQKTFISVDEEGVEAAATTSVTMELMSARPQQKIIMTLDRPFLYAIRDKKTDTILFIGKVGNPNE